MKRQVKELKAEISARDEEILSYKKNFKNTKINELDIELRSYMDECLRLKHLLEDTVRSKDPLADPDQLSKIEEQFQQQNTVINNLHNENQELQNMIAHKDNETIEWRNLVEDYQKRIDRLRPAAKDNKKLRKMNKDKKIELQRIRQELLLLRSRTSPEVKEKVGEIMKKHDALQGKVGNNKAKINSLKKSKNKLQAQKKELIDRIEELENERDQLTQDYEEECSLKKKFEELYGEEREKNISLRQHLDELTKDGKKSYPRNQSARPKSASKYGRKPGSADDTNNAEDEQAREHGGTRDAFGSDASDEKEVLLDKVSFSKVDSVAGELRETLITRKIPFENLKNEIPNEPLALSEFRELLTNNYNISEKDAKLAARYIYEEDDIDPDGKVMYDELKQLNPDVILERLQKFICKNNTINPYQVDDLDNEIDEDIPQESLPKESIEVPDDDNYSDIDDDFEDNQQTKAHPTSESPRISEEINKNNDHLQQEPPVDDESEMGEEEGLDIAEKCFSLMADKMKDKKTTTINHFKDYIGNQVIEAEDGEKFEVVYISPTDFLEGLDDLGLELTEKQIKCLMIILVKPELDNVILVQDLCMVMENFGIEEDIDDITDGSPTKSENQDPPQGILII